MGVLVGCSLEEVEVARRLSLRNARKQAALYAIGNALLVLFTITNRDRRQPHRAPRQGCAASGQSFNESMPLMWRDSMLCHEARRTLCHLAMQYRTLHKYIISSFAID